MKFLQKKWNDKSFTETAYVVLSYEQLLQVNGAGGSSSGGGGPSGPSEQNSSNTSNNSSSGPNGIDNTNKKDIVKYFTDSGYELLSDKKDSSYTDGSQKEYMQSQFEMLSAQDGLEVTKCEGRFDGVSDGNHSYNDYDTYTISGGNKVYMEAIDINRDGKIDYVK